ncbi:nucleotidyltransferase family protein [Nonomuraea jabiensis]|uniref:Nucleotidyltransferase family protein n=1 Tax=Nonomuraea jabiensis TaxID=882448 RepID=A0A7W9L8X0_9ACTN|nr:nucleotidyltransferase family protein [Nonomuraea jabiensis]MBB5774970.1 hypothetical protein [Nonomuraea jabiensis]
MSLFRHAWWSDRPEFDLLLSLSRIEVTTSEAERCRRLLRDHKNDFDWGLFIDQAGRHKVLPLVGRHIVRHNLHNGGDGIPLIPYRWLHNSVYFANKRRNEVLGQEFAVLFGALNAAGVPYAVRKGPVIAETLYRDPGLRRMNDLDLLIDRDDAERVGDILAAHGYTQGRLSADGTSIEPFTRSTQAFWRMHVPNELPYAKLSDREEVDVFFVDLCLSVSKPRSKETLTTRDLLARRRPTRLCGADAYALALEDQFVDLCLHFRKEATSRHYIEAGVDLQLLKFLDIASMCAYVTTESAWKAVLDHAAESGAADGVYYAMYYAALLYPGDVPEDRLAALRPDDLGFLEEYGAVDGRVETWDLSFADRLFARDRSGAVRGSSTVPRV